MVAWIKRKIAEFLKALAGRYIDRAVGIEEETSSERTTDEKAALESADAQREEKAAAITTHQSVGGKIKQSGSPLL